MPAQMRCPINFASCYTSTTGVYYTRWEQAPNTSSPLQFGSAPGLCWTSACGAESCWRPAAAPSCAVHTGFEPALSGRTRANRAVAVPPRADARVRRPSPCAFCDSSSAGRSSHAGLAPQWSPARQRSTSAGPYRPVQQKARLAHPRALLLEALLHVQLGLSGCGSSETAGRRKQHSKVADRTCSVAKSLCSSSSILAEGAYAWSSWTTDKLTARFEQSRERAAPTRTSSIEAMEDMNFLFNKASLCSAAEASPAGVGSSPWWASGAGRARCERKNSLEGNLSQHSAPHHPRFLNSPRRGSSYAYLYLRCSAHRSPASRLWHQSCALQARLSQMKQTRTCWVVAGAPCARWRAVRGSPSMRSMAALSET